MKKNKKLSYSPFSHCWLSLTIHFLPISSAIHVCSMPFEQLALAHGMGISSETSSNASSSSDRLVVVRRYLVHRLTPGM